MNLPIFDNQFWNILKQIDGLTTEQSLSQFLSSNTFEKSAVREVISFMNNFGLNIELKDKKGECYLVPDKKNKKIKLELNFSEWLALQSNFPLMKELHSLDLNKDLISKLEQVHEQYPDFKLIENVAKFSGDESEIFKSRLTKTEHKFANLAEEALEKDSLIIASLEDKKFEIYLHKLILLEGKLTIVGEETIDRCLISYSLEELDDIKLTAINDYSVNYSRFEVEEFIMAIRAVSGREERLVLKINQNEDVNLSPSYQFLGHPYMTSNSDGDLIWAASVEISNELYDWIISMGKKVEVLDPMGVKSEFEKYREVKFAELDSTKKLKKAS